MSIIWLAVGICQEQESKSGRSGPVSQVPCEAPDQQTGMAADVRLAWPSTTITRRPAMRIETEDVLMAERNVDRIIAAARHVFTRYGYRRATMGEIATAAGMSRAALYLVYSSKEDVLTAVVTRMFATMLGEIRDGLGRWATVEEQLTFALDVWSVAGFELVQSSPDAMDLYESGHQFAAEAMTTATADFIAILADLLDPLVRQQTRVTLSSTQIAQVIVSAVPGFKGAATTAEQFRSMIARLITMVLASLDGLSAPAAGRMG